MILRCVLAFALAAGAVTTAAQAQVVNADDLGDRVHLEHYAIALNGVQMSADTAVYFADDETIYVSGTDLDAWHLKRSAAPAFELDGQGYYGLQTELDLATSFDERLEQVEIIAPRTAFAGQPVGGPPKIDPGRGAFMNYELQRDTGTYDFFLAGKGVFETKYISTTADGLEFHRARTRWWYADPVHHTLFTIGEGTSGDNWLATSVPFAGIRYASDFSSDPTYVGHEPLSVSGVAASPSQLEVSIDNVLVLRRDVPQGPFTVRDLPPSAAYSDIVMVLTDANGKRSLQIARPVVDPDFLAKGTRTFGINAGIGQDNVGLRNSFYRGGVFSTQLRFGLTDRLTAEVFGESIAGENFADAGADIRLGEGQTLQFRIGGGNKRHASQYRYNFRRGKFQIKTQLSLNSLKTQPEQGFDFDSVAQIQESSEFSVDFSRFISFGLRLDRNRDSNGSNSSMLSARSRFRRGNLVLEITPFYDFVRRRTSGNIVLTYRMGSYHRLSDRTSVTAAGDISTSLEYRKEQSGPGDPIALAIRASASRSQDRRFNITDQLPWMTGTFNYQQQNGRSIYEPDLLGALAFVGGRIYPLRSVNSDESFGVVHIPGLKNVRVSINDSFAGRTDARGDLLVRELAPFRDNVISVAVEDLPLDVNIADPQHVVPGSLSPLSFYVPILSRGGFTMTVADASGVTLPAGSRVESINGSFLVGYQGRVFVTGVVAGTQHFTGTGGAGACAFDVNVPAQTGNVPDLGKYVCR